MDDGSADEAATKLQLARLQGRAKAARLSWELCPIMHGLGNAERPTGRCGATKAKSWGRRRVRDKVRVSHNSVIVAFNCEISPSPTPRNPTTSSFTLFLLDPLIKTQTPSKQLVFDED